MNFSFGLPIGCQKYLCIPINTVKGIDWFKKKKALQETNGLDIGCKFASFLV